MGSIPSTMASAVMTTGRRRVVPASHAARRASLPSSLRSFAKATTRTLFEVATPMLMIAPMSAGTESVVPVAKSIHTMPASAPGSAVRMMSGSRHDWKLTTSRR